MRQIDKWWRHGGRDSGAYGLTEKQKDIANYIARMIKARGVSPSYDEMKDALGLESKSGIHRIVTALENRGMIRRRANMSRSISMTEAYWRSEAASDLDRLVEKIGVADATQMLRDYLESADDPF